MNKFTTLLTSAVLIGSAGIAAAHPSMVTGTVTSVEPVLEYYPVYEQQCYEEIRQQPKHGMNGQGALNGAIIGGLLGAAIADNRDGAAVGAILGGVVGANSHNNSRVVTKSEWVCDEYYSHDSSEIVGYTVSYKYSHHNRTQRGTFEVGPYEGTKYWSGKSIQLKIK